MFSRHVSEQLPCKRRGKNNVSSTLLQNNNELRLFQPPFVAEYLRERQYWPICENRVPYVKGIPLQFN